MPVARLDPTDNTRTFHAECMKLVAERGDRRAFGALFEFFGPRLKTYLKRMGANDAQAEEIVQDVMLTVWRKAGSFNPSTFSGAPPSRTCPPKSRSCSLHPRRRRLKASPRRRSTRMSANSWRPFRPNSSIF